MKSLWLRSAGVLLALTLIGIGLLILRKPASAPQSTTKEPDLTSSETKPTPVGEATNESTVEADAVVISNPPAPHSDTPAFVRNEPKDRMRMSGVRVMRESLDLTDDQVKQLEPILEQQRKELIAFRRQTSLSRKERIARLKQMRETQEAQLQSILTPEQFEQWRKGPLNLQASQQQQPEPWITTHPTNAASSPPR